ncbi:allatostatin-A receptor-like [Strongylocentrotus purpuratus]|uniref:G-protein coupled receptors family 1 profile domain-containing protein n=2 Tax=Strongylocentrotus purpuratus TaxID=7668 RepID=A0A7M7PTP2_STRPU|nr:allatostatin-A receptor-like [Strongylocentrotus purpuratus]
MAYESTSRKSESSTIIRLSDATSNDDGPTEFPLNITEIEDRSEETLPKATFGWSWRAMEWPWWIDLQLVSAILGIVGNLLVILVVFRKNSSSRSTDILVGNLAVADFLLSIAMIPLPRAQTMPLSAAGRLYCIFIYSQTMKWMLITVSSYQLVIICFDRFFAVVYPLTFNRMVTKRRVYICTSLVWLTFMTAGSRDIFIFKVDDITGRCVRQRFSPEGDMAFAAYFVCLRIGVPTFLILLTQLLIAKKLHQEAQHFSKILTEGSVTAKPSNHLTARTRVLKMMLIVIIVFIICWAPSQIAFFCANMGFIARSYLGSPLQRSLITMAFFNSCLNPFIYTARNPQFRTALKGIFICSRASHDPVFEHKLVETSSSAPVTAPVSLSSV